MLLGVLLRVAWWLVPFWKRKYETRAAIAMAVIILLGTLSIQSGCSHPGRLVHGSSGLRFNRYGRRRDSRLAVCCCPNVGGLRSQLVSGPLCGSGRFSRAGDWKRCVVFGLWHLGDARHLGRSRSPGRAFVAFKTRTFSTQAIWLTTHLGWFACCVPKVGVWW